ncbi:MAG: hypothetical protein AB7F43_08000 [Bacteriovoracia bacterium]
MFYRATLFIVFCVLFQTVFAADSRLREIERILCGLDLKNEEQTANTLATLAPTVIRSGQEDEIKKIKLILEHSLRSFPGNTILTSLFVQYFGSDPRIKYTLTQEQPFLLGEEFSTPLKIVHNEDGTALGLAVKKNKYTPLVVGVVSARNLDPIISEENNKKRRTEIKRVKPNSLLYLDDQQDFEIRKTIAGYALIDQQGFHSWDEEGFPLDQTPAYHEHYYTDPEMIYVDRPTVSSEGKSLFIVSDHIAEIDLETNDLIRVYDHKTTLPKVADLSYAKSFSVRGGKIFLFTQDNRFKQTLEIISPDGEGDLTSDIIKIDDDIFYDKDIVDIVATDDGSKIFVVLRSGTDKRIFSVACFSVNQNATRGSLVSKTDFRQLGELVQTKVFPNRSTIGLLFTEDKLESLQRWVRSVSEPENDVFEFGELVELSMSEDSQRLENYSLRGHLLEGEDDDSLALGLFDFSISPTSNHIWVSGSNSRMWMLNFSIASQEK